MLKPVLLRPILATLVVAIAPLVGSGIARASAPFNTSPPTLDLGAGSLVAHNGGFASYSGTPDRYEFRFVRDSDYAVREDGSSNIYQLVTGDCGSFHADVRAGIHSVYIRQDGTVAYDTIEWSDWVPTNTVNVGASCASAPTPAVVARPAISGDAQQGKQLSGSNGSWSGTTLVGFRYQWQRCTAAGSGCVDIPGATSAAYQVSPADVGSRLRIVVTATNSAGALSSASDPTEVVRGLAPVETALPAVSGLPWQGSTLSVTSGTWTDTQPITYAFQWQRCSAHMNGCTAIAGATGATYVPGAADLGSRLRVVVTATSAGSSASAASPATPPIQVAQPSGTNLALSAARVVAGDAIRIDAGPGQRPAKRRGDTLLRIRVYETRGFLVAGATVIVSTPAVRIERLTDSSGETLVHMHVPAGQRAPLVLTVSAAAGSETATTTLRLIVR